MAKQNLETNESLLLSRISLAFLLWDKRFFLSFYAAAGDAFNEILLQREKNEDGNNGGNG